jgi:hypothetical protein
MHEVVLEEYDEHRNTFLKLQQKSFTPWVAATSTALHQTGVIEISKKQQNNPNDDEQFDAKSFYLSMVGIEDKIEPKTTIESNGIAHVFDKYRKSDVKPPVIFEISSESSGFKLMTKMGWNAEQGLGPQEKADQSILFPVPTQFKTDRTGVGSRAMRKLPSRVTHFASKKFDSNGNEILPVDTKLIMHNKVEKSKPQKMTLLLKKKSVVKQLHRKERKRLQKIQDAVLGRCDIPE